MRKTLSDSLLFLAKEDPSLFVLTPDVGYNELEPFAAAHPERFVNVGIAEAGLISIAAGIALSGKKSVAYSISTFMPARCLEQIRVDVCYHNLPVTLIGSGAGLTYGTLGPTHHGTEDIALMRCLPNMTVIAPCDPYEFSQLLPQAIRKGSPCYIRIGRSTEPAVYGESKPEIKIGKGALVRSFGEDFAIFACGNMVFNALECLNRLNAKGKKGKLFSMHTIKPLDAELVAQASAKMPVITMEEHSIIGGLGSAVAECISDEGMKNPRLLRIAVPDSFQKKVGTHDYLRKMSGLDPDSVEKRIAAFLGR
jgi:transketolase